MDFKRPVFTRRPAQLQGDEKNNGKEEYSILLSMKREGTQNLSEKEIPKGKDPKVPVRQESRSSRYATPFIRGNAKWNPRVIIGTHQNAHTTNPKVDANEEISACSGTQAKPVTTKMVMKRLPTNRKKQKHCIVS